MIRLLNILLFLLITCNGIFAQKDGYVLPTHIEVPRHYSQPSNNSSNVIPQGWYEASVRYTSYTGHQAIYTLNVLVEQSRVIAIDFGNGGSVHKGHNNSGYEYVGGSLTFQKDVYGNIVAASTTIYVTDYNGKRKYDIYIE